MNERHLPQYNAPMHRHTKSDLNVINDLHFEMLKLSCRQYQWNVRTTDATLQGYIEDKRIKTGTY